MTLGAVCVLQP